MISFQVKLYDLRSFEKGPFVTFNLPREKQCEWTGLKFSPNGQSILLTTNGSVMRLIEAFHGQPLQTFSFSPCHNKALYNTKLCYGKNHPQII